MSEQILKQPEVEGSMEVHGNETIGINSETNSSVMDFDRKQRIEKLFGEVINNPRFWQNSHRPTRLEEALRLPIYDDRALQQFYISARDELNKAALEYAVQNQIVPVMPTKEEICNLAEQKYKSKQEKAAKKSN